MVNTSYGSSNALLDQREQETPRLSGTLVDEILARHDYPEDTANLQVSAKRRAQGVLTLHQQEHIAGHFQWQHLNVMNTKIIQSSLENCWKKQEYSTGVKILLDNIDMVFTHEADKCIAKYIEMMQTALEWKLIKKQRNNIRAVLHLFQIRFSQKSQSTSPKTETTT